MASGEIKVIDFGESKDFFREADDGGDPTTATIRGTPQYLSPILWKAHVVDGNSRFAKHNIYKSGRFAFLTNDIFDSLSIMCVVNLLYRCVFGWSLILSNGYNG